MDASGSWQAAAAAFANNWVPAFAGMTKREMGTRFRANDERALGIDLFLIHR